MRTGDQVMRKVQLQAGVSFALFCEPVRLFAILELWGANRGWAYGWELYGVSQNAVPEYSQKPVHRDDECDVIRGQPHRCQHDDHGDQTSLRNPSCPNACRRGCDAVDKRTQTERFTTKEYLAKLGSPCLSGEPAL